MTTTTHPRSADSMTRGRTTIRANRTMLQDLSRREREAEEARRQQSEEAAEMKASRPAVKRAAEIAQKVDHEGAGEVEYVDRGPVRITTRDGLLWLISKGKLSQSQRDAAERYRSDYAVVHGGQLRSCINDGVGGGGGDGSMSALVAARARLADARGENPDLKRRGGLNQDPGLIRVMNQVAGEGEHIREIVRQQAITEARRTCSEPEDSEKFKRQVEARVDYQSTVLETEFKIACRMLARHYGLST